MMKHVCSFEMSYFWKEFRNFFWGKQTKKRWMIVNIQIHRLSTPWFVSRICALLCLKDGDEWPAIWIIFEAKKKTNKQNIQLSGKAEIYRHETFWWRAAWRAAKRNWKLGRCKLSDEKNGRTWPLNGTMRLPSDPLGGLAGSALCRNKTNRQEKKRPMKTSKSKWPPLAALETFQWINLIGQNEIICDVNLKFILKKRTSSEQETKGN